jgi:hypothetical protein
MQQSVKAWKTSSAEPQSREKIKTGGFSRLFSAVLRLCVSALGFLAECGMLSADC